MWFFILLTQININILNPDFENWIDTTHPDGWKVEHSGALPVYKELDTVYSGNYSVKVVRASKTTSYKEALSQWITVEYPGMEYKFTGYIYDNDTDVYGRITISWYKSDSTYLNNYALSQPSSNQNIWQELSVSDIAPDSAGLLKLYLRIYLDTTNVDSLGHLFYDFVAGLEIKEKTKLITSSPKLNTKKGIYDITGRKNRRGKILFIKGEKTKKIIRIK